MNPMHPHTHARRARRRGYTFLELMIALTLLSAVLTVAMALLAIGTEGARGSEQQITFNAEARKSMARVFEAVTASSTVFVNVDGDSLELRSPDNDLSWIRYRDGDDEPLTLEDNVLYWTDGDTESIVARYVTQIDEDTPMFAMIRRAAHMRFHIGDIGAAGDTDNQTGRGYQGVRVAFTAKPRNAPRMWSSSDFEGVIGSND